MRAAGSNTFTSAHSSEARVRSSFFSLTQDLHGGSIIREPTNLIAIRHLFSSNLRSIVVISTLVLWVSHSNDLHVEEESMKRVLFLLVAVGAFTCMDWAADAAKEMDAAAQVLQNMTSSNQIPTSLISQAKCIAVIPKLTKGGFIVGGEHGNGVISCRTSSGWSAPAFITMTGGSVGLQAIKASKSSAVAIGIWAPKLWLPGRLPVRDEPKALAGRLRFSLTPMQAGLMRVRTSKAQN